MAHVSIIVPCYNEQRTIRMLLEALYGQTYPRQNLEVIIADGRSTDRTREEIAVFQAAHPDLLIKLVDNPQRNIPAALNRALAVARGQFVLRLDAHSVPYPDYITRCVRALEAGLADNVGGIWEIRPGGGGWVARGIAAAAGHPFGVGDARYRFGRTPRYVDTVPFGAYRRALFDRLGAFDETLLTNEDYEFNVRLRRLGGRIWLDPKIRSVYFARPSLASLARQYWRYGFWKARMLMRYPDTFRWRQLAPLLVLSLAALALAAAWLPLAGWLLALEAGIYLVYLALAGLHLAWARRDPALLLSAPLAIAAMHLSWGSGFLWSLIRAALTALRRRRPSGKHPVEDPH